jgi:DNA repair protein RadD
MTARAAATAVGFGDRPAPVLRPYQIECVDALRRAYGAGRRAPLLQLPTGGGKTIIFGEVAHGARAKGRRVLVLVHRRELIRQASDKLDWAGVPHGIIASGFMSAVGELVQIGSLPTIAQRLASLRDFDLVVVDEAHHARADSWRAVLAALSGARLLGVTATPARLDGRGLGVAAGGVFDEIVCGGFVTLTGRARAARRVKVAAWLRSAIAAIVFRPRSSSTRSGSISALR